MSNNNTIDTNPILRIYANSVPWALDRIDIGIINRMHGRNTKEHVVKRLWDKACKN